MTRNLRPGSIWMSILAAGGVMAAALAAQERAPQIESIRAADLRADLFFLAGDALQGRLTATPTNLLAGDYIKSRFERMGLKPAGPNGSFFQDYPGPANFESSAASYWPPKPPRIERFTLGTWMDRVRIPGAEISPALAETLLQSTGQTLADLAPSVETSTGTTPVAIGGVEIEITVAVNRHLVPDRNVIAAVDGADPKLKDEAVMVCAHYDHNGADGDQIFNGADDDGSGTVGLLEIAEAYALAAHAGQRPRRSVIFAAWNSEERGLLGAWAFTERPAWPLDRIVAVLNMDMIGRNEEVQEGGGARFRGLDLQTAESNQNAVNVIGSSRSADLKTAVGDANRPIGLEIKFRYDNNVSNLMRRSDHWPFLQRGVPALWFHTGLHPDYHTVYDRPEKINYAKMEKIARLIHQMSWNLAQQPARPRLDGQKTTSVQDR